MAHGSLSLTAPAQVARTFKATPLPGGSILSAISVRWLARSQHSCDGCPLFQSVCAADCLIRHFCPAATPSLAHLAAPDCARLFLQERDGRSSPCCSPRLIGLCGNSPRDNRRDKTDSTHLALTLATVPQPRTGCT